MSSSLINMLIDPSSTTDLQALGVISGDSYKLINRDDPFKSLYNLQNLQEMEDDLQEQLIEIGGIDPIGAASLLTSRQFWDYMDKGKKKYM